jgi:hypothetical protein
MFNRTTDSDYYGSHPKDLQGLEEVNKVLDVKSSTYVLGDELDEEAPTCVAISFPPNWELPRHSHGCDRLEIIIEGSLSAGDVILGPGDIMRAGEGEMYGPHQTGPEGCKTLEVFGTRRGYHVLTFESPAGDVETIDIAAEDSLKNQRAAGIL